MKSLLTGTLLCITCSLFAQENINIDTIQISVSNLTDVIVYANKFPENTKRVVQTIHVLKNKIQINNQPNTADALINSGSLFVQKSQQGGGSPVIRGFEASRVLLMVDGVRMNNAIYRAGHLQNIITVDNTILDRIEILYGPSSTIYGSDALGGVINLFTKNPIITQQSKSFSGNALINYASATDAVKTHADINYSSKNWASLSSITLSRFGDVIQGDNRSSSYPDFGKKYFYVDRINGVDTSLTNPNPNKQIASGYHQIDFLQKFLFQPKSNTQHLFNFQFSTTGNIPRYDRLTETSNNIPSYAEWNYGPQKRNLLSYQFTQDKRPEFIRELKLNLNYQSIEESRITRRFKNNNRDTRIEQVNVFGLSIDAKHYYKKSEFQFGIEANYNNVKSTAFRENIINNNQNKILTRYADGPTNMFYSGAYIQHTLKINDNLTLNDGLRLNLVTLHANFIDTATLHLPFNQASQNNFALTGNLGLVYVSKNNLRISTVLSSGFRSPNVDDLTKVFDTKIGYVVVPNSSIKPEYTYNSEINISKTNSMLSYGFSVFYTWFKNAIVVDKYELNGQSSIVYQGVNSDVYAPQNKAKAYLYGYSVNAGIKISSTIEANGIYTYTYGRYTNNGSTIPLDHIPPNFGKISISHKTKKLFIQLNTLFNGWKRITDYNLNGEDNERYATKDGMPSWMIVNFQSGIQLSKNVNFSFTIENIFDKNYRYFASGISASGRNFQLSLKTNF